MTRNALRAVLFGAAALASACTSVRPTEQAVKPAAAPSAKAVQAESVSRRTRRQAVQSILPKNVRVVVADDGVAERSASGVSVGSELTSDGVTSYVLTNAHVVVREGLKDPNYVVLLETPAGDTQEFAAEVVAEGSVPNEDLAVLAVHGIRIDGAELAADDDIVVGDDVVVIGAPYGRPLSVSSGIVSQVDFEKGLPRRPAMIKTDAPIGYGASGGGMYSVETGKLMGIVEGYRTAKVTIPGETQYSFDVPMPGETFVAPVTKIRRFLAEKGLNRFASLKPASTQASR